MQGDKKKVEFVMETKVAKKGRRISCFSSRSKMSQMRGGITVSITNARFESKTKEKLDGQDGAIFTAK